MTDFMPIIRQREKEWNDLQAGIVPIRLASADKDDRAAPSYLVLDRFDDCYWHQRSPYNDSTPVLTPGSDEHCSVGCVATSMAQIMSYWRWPADPWGSSQVYYKYFHSDDWVSTPLACDPGTLPYPGRLDWIPDGGGQLRMQGYWDWTMFQDVWPQISDSCSIDGTDALWECYNSLTLDSTLHIVHFSDVTYDWSNVCDSCLDVPSAGAALAARVGYHAGITVNMYYRTGQSTAFAEDISPAMETHFGFDPDINHWVVTFGNAAEEIRWDRVLSLDGQGPSGGHAWTVYGYNTSTSQLLMKMGWTNGYRNGWYTLDTCLFPSDMGMIRYAAPESVVRFVENNTIGAGYGDGSPGNVYSDLDYAVTMTDSGTTLIMYSGDKHVINGTSYTISKPVTLRGRGVTIGVSDR